MTTTTAERRALRCARRIIEEVARIRRMDGYTGNFDGWDIAGPADIWIGTSLHYIEEKAQEILALDPEETTA